jgi:hypothetical protein
MPILRAQPHAGSAASLLALGARFGSGCVLRTASASISYSSALVFFGSRLGGCHCVMIYMWGRRSVI